MRRVLGAWLVVALGLWSAAVVRLGLWSVVAAHWATGAAMVVGSSLGAATPLGGGAVGFALLVLLGGQPAAVGRDFAFSIQSLGLTTATVYLVATRKPIAWRFVAWAAGASLVTTPVVVVAAADMPDLAVKLTFSVLWAVFGLVQLVRMSAFASQVGGTAIDHPLAGIAVGVVGGIASAVTGAGANTILYLVVVLLFRADVRVAVGSAIVVMSATSVVGLATVAATVGIQPAVFPHWIAAVPAVVIGGPLGAAIMSRIPRRATLVAVAVLCLLQFVVLVVREFG